MTYKWGLVLSVLFQVWTLVIFMLGMIYGAYTERGTSIKNNGSTGPGSAPYADKASP
jgi:hypothetical protein